MSRTGQDVETWNEGASDLFIEFGEDFVPWRDDIRDGILDLIPAEKDEEFVAVELGVGSGWLSNAILQRFSRSHMSGLDGSHKMLEASSKRLMPFEGRFDLRPFRLQDSSWTEEITRPVRAFVSVLVVHHLDGEHKRRLYTTLLKLLEPGGALLFADTIKPASSQAREYYRRLYDEDVRRHSMARMGNLDGYQRFVDRQWNLFQYPDPVDKPSTVEDHPRWLKEAGFTGVEVWWARSGHALYGGYAPRT